jgi:hypothetical protein
MVSSFQFSVADFKLQSENWKTENRLFNILVVRAISPPPQIATKRCESAQKKFWKTETKN